MIGLEKADNLNDRRNLVLLQYKKRKGIRDKCLIKRLNRLYPDNNVYESKIIDELGSREFIDIKANITENFKFENAKILNIYSNEKI